MELYAQRVVFKRVHINSLVSNTSNVTSRCLFSLFSTYLFATACAI